MKKIYEDVLDNLEKIEPDVPVQEEDAEDDMLHRFVCMAPVYVDDIELYERIVGGILSVRADSYKIVHGTNGTKSFTFMFNADDKSLLRILFDVLTQTILDIYRIYPDEGLSPAFRSNRFNNIPILSERSKQIFGETISILSGGIVRKGDVQSFINRIMARKTAVSSRNQ